MGMNVDAAHLYLRASMTSASSRAVTCLAAWLDLATANISQENPKNQQDKYVYPQYRQPFVRLRCWGFLLYVGADGSWFSDRGRTEAMRYR